MPQIARGEKKALEFVSLRFCAITMGMDYAQTAAFMTRIGLRPSSGPLRKWSEFVNNPKARIIDGKSLRILVEHVDPMATGTAPFEVPKDVMERLKRAWDKIGAPGSKLLFAGAAKKRGRPPKTETVKIHDDEEPTQAQSILMRLDAAKLRTHESNASYREAQAKRLSGLMCDRITVENEARAAGIVLQRDLASLPAMITGELVKIASFSDGQLRAIERMLEDFVPRILHTIREDLKRAETTGAIVASAQRYGERDVAAL